ncbi:hypothetical protein GCM10010358_25260 [Streptomyces minutiscleroticus]|uniref:Uncharacterized protein n=1 Tax=Streptomyces minutiscleroticus TaxID=68238 RepID=A0A918NIF2_9ACTN|nr:hypothetical protein GCM10010358_25260 [Streptomyces minutiscleroticus]
MIRTWETDSPGLRERLTAHTPLRRAADPQEIAQVAAWLLKRPLLLRDRHSPTGRRWRTGLNRGRLHPSLPGHPTHDT